MSVANITSIEALTSLTSAQLSQLSQGIDQQIAADVSTIAANRSTIAGISLEINAPGGLQDQFNTADYQYNSSVTAYQLTSTAIANALSTYNGDKITLSSMYNISTSYVSTLHSYESQYSTIVRSLQQNASTVYGYELHYQQDLLDLSTNTILYNASVLNLSTISSAVYYDRSSLNNLSLNPQQLSSISSTYANDRGLYNQISTQVGTYLNTAAYLQTDISNTYYAISSILELSTFLILDKTSYASTIDYYRKLDDATESTIKIYSDQASSISGQISTIKERNRVIVDGMVSEKATIASNGASFYSLYQQGLNAECDEYLYGIQEFNSQVGYITASLGIAINANSIAIDNCTFQLVDPNYDPNNSQGLRGSTITGKQTLSNDNAIINSIIARINSLDGQFASIIGYINDEKGQRQTFLNKRKQIFNTYEVPALGYSASEIAGIRNAYLAAFADLNTTITTISSDIYQRGLILGQIQAVTDLVKAQINSYFQKYLFISDDQLPNALTRVLGSDGVTPLGGSYIVPEYTPPNPVLLTNAPYAFISPIVF
jgi:hypothetical protein